MNLAVMLRAQLQNAGDLGVATLRNLEDMITNLTRWGAGEHNEDGTHAAVTATSAVVNGLLSADRYVAKKILIWDYLTDPSGVIKGPGVEDAGLIVHIDSTPGAGGIARTLYSIDATGRQPGEIVWFVCANGNTAPGGINFSQTASSANRLGFPGFKNFTGVIGANVLFQANRVFPIMYLPNTAGLDVGFPSHPWHLGHP